VNVLTEIKSETNFYAYSIIPTLKAFKNATTFSETSYYIVGINQQTGITYIEEWDGLSQDTEFGAAWADGYYTIHIVFVGKDDGKTVRVNLEKKPLFWKKVA